MHHEDVRLVRMPAGNVDLEGELAVPDDPRGIVVFAHGSGSSRHSPRNRYVAQSLRADARVATLLFGLLSEAEADEDLRTQGLRFDIPLLTQRIEDVTSWLLVERMTQGLGIGYFGASTGAAAALVAAAEHPEDVQAVVARGGRPDLAGPEVLDRVRASTLLIVGGDDTPVIDINREALEHLPERSQFDVIPGASHLFEEPGALEQVARRAAAWFSRWLAT